MKTKDKKSINCIHDVVEYMLHAMSKNGLDTTKISKLPEFLIIVDMLKAIIDNDLDIPNELSQKIDSIKKELDIDNDTPITIH